MRSISLAYVVILQVVEPAWAGESSMDRLVAAYPEFLERHDQVNIIWKDGTAMPIADRTNTTFDDKLKHATLADQMSLPYPKAWPATPPGPEHDPGRFRNVAFFNKMYGDCKKGEVNKHLTYIRWLPAHDGAKLKVTSTNGVAARLQEVSNEIDKLPAALRKYATPSAGTFVCRTVKDTGVSSMHAWAAAIDLNTKFSDYWLWRKGGPYRNRIPSKIVQIFEHHGFIWGGKWGHYDTMHFEYRPEMLE